LRFCYTNTMTITLVIAHRGDSSNALENSLESIHRALSLSVDMIEIDIRRSRDNGLFVMHDKLTGRTATKNIDIERATSEKIAKVKLKNGEPVPSLADVLRLVEGKCGVNLEIKSSGAGALTAQYLLSSAYKGSILVSSFQEDEVAAVRLAMPLLPTSMIFDVFAPHTIPSYLTRGYNVVSLRKRTVNEELVAACHEQGLPVYVWTVDEEDEMRKFISWGVDGIYTNRPGVLKDLLENRG
jgi:glycerophosphoryl diester phosphodiesterase